MNTTNKDTPATGRATSTLEARRALLPEGTELYLSTGDMCAVAGVSKSTLFFWLAQPGLGLAELCIRIPGGHRRIPERRFSAWLERRREPKAARP